MMSDEERLVRRVTIETLDRSRDPDPGNDLDKVLDRVVRRHGEDSVREFVRLTVRGDMGNGEAGTYIYGDAAVGMQLGVAVNHIAKLVE